MAVPNTRTTLPLSGRRALLRGFCAAVGAAATTLVARAAPAAGHMHAGGLIDVHHHIRPPGAPAGFARMTAGWSVEGAVADMDRCGIATGIAYPGPILSGTDEQKRQTARLWNDFGAKLGQDHPGRFGLFASLPFPDVAGSIAEVDYALDHLRADGFGLATSYGDRWLGDESLWPIYEKLNSRAAVVFVHPHDAACCAAASMTYIRPTMDGSWIEWPMNTARTIMSLMVSGTLRRFPRIRFIFAHGGGVMPLLVRRIADFTAWPEVGEKGLKQIFPNGIEAEFGSLYFEGAQAWRQPNLGALRALVPDTRLLFGSDYPFFPLDHASRQFAEAGLGASAARAIGRANAAALLPRWAG